VFPEWYALSPYIKQASFVFKGFKMVDKILVKVQIIVTLTYLKGIAGDYCKI